MHRESQQFESQNNPMYRSSASNSSYINRQVAYQAPQVQSSHLHLQQSSGSIGAAVISRGVPSQEIRYEDQTAGLNKREEKESHYSRHVTSNTSFGG